MCAAEKRNLQQGMNFRQPGRRTVVLMSLRPGAPYADRIEDRGRTLIYEGHDAPRTSSSPAPKEIDQPLHTPSGTLTQNGRFYEAAMRYKHGSCQPELVQVYEKIRPGIWAYNGAFALVDAWMESNGRREVFKFRLELTDGDIATNQSQDFEHGRLIPSAVKIEVWKRDRGRCVVCGSADNLHFDHDIPFSKGGTSLTALNVQLMCTRHNLEKSARIA